MPNTKLTLTLVITMKVQDIYNASDFMMDRENLSTQSQSSYRILPQEP